MVQADLTSDGRSDAPPGADAVVPRRTADRHAAAKIETRPVIEAGGTDFVAPGRPVGSLRKGVSWREAGNSPPRANRGRESSWGGCGVNETTRLRRAVGIESSPTRYRIAVIRIIRFAQSSGFLVRTCPKWKAKFRPFISKMGRSDSCFAPFT